MFSEKDFGKLPSGEAVTLFTLKNTASTEIDIMTYGGVITRWTAADRNGAFEDVVLGYDSLAGYLRESPYFGAITGRYGNRIANGQFVLDGQTYNLAKNNGLNSLHGGLKGFDKVVWAAKPFTKENGVGLELTYTSPDGDEGFPGALATKVTYFLDNDNALHIDYEATTDKPTVVNVTNHTYFNLTGGKTDVTGHELTMQAAKFLPVDKTLIPTGQLQSVQGSPFDFTTATAVGKRIDDTTNVQINYGGGYDHCWVLNDASDKLKPFAQVYEPTSGRVLEVSTTEPAVQFYTGNFLTGSMIGKNNVKYTRRMGLCLETQHYPDSPNQAQFPSTVLRPGQTYRTQTVYKFSTK